MENRKRERIIEAGMALLLVITLLAAGQSGKIPVVKSQEIQVQADSGKENESKEKGNTENTDSETTGTEKNSGDTGKNESGSDMESVAVAGSAAPNTLFGRLFQYPIMGKSDVSVQEMVDYFNRSGRTYPAAALAAGGADSIETFCQIYYEEATAEGVRPEVAYVQAMKETGFLQYGGDASIEQYNFAGIGTTGNGVPGNSYADVRTGILAQVQHLKAYATTEPLNEACVDERYEYVKKAAAPYVQWLGQQENPQGTGWATGKNYGYDIVEMIKKMREGSET